MAHITFIHGIANKPPADDLLKLWRRKLADGDGVDLATEGVTSSMVYWADVMYAAPLVEEAAQESLEAVEAMGAQPVDMSWREEASAGDQIWIAELAAKLKGALAADETATMAAPGSDAAAVAGQPQELEGLERIPLPWFVKERLMDVLLRDVHHYLFNVDHSPRPGATYRVQDEIRGRTLKALGEGAARPGPHLVVSHSMGTVIAYDCLQRVAGAPRVDGLMTIGCPLGLDEVQDKLQPGWSRDDGFPSARVGGQWTNVYDRLDPVAGFDPRLANDFRRGGAPVVRDVNEQSYGKWRHDISKYLAGRLLRENLRDMLGI